jgi:hypothetical protein
MTARAALNVAYAEWSATLSNEGRDELDDALLSPEVKALRARAARIAHARGIGDE